MKNKLLTLILITAYCTSINSQCFCPSSTAGKNTINAYCEVDFMPKHDFLASYSLLRYGVTKWLDFGFDFTAGSNTANMGGFAYAGYRFNNWIGAGIMIDPQFDLNKGFQFTELKNLYILDGSLTPSGKLWWTSNTWHNIERNGNWSLNQSWYIGYEFDIKGGHTLYPAIDVRYSWRFDEPVDMGVVLYYSYKWFDAFAYVCELLPGRHEDCSYMPCFCIGIDLYIDTRCNEKDK